MIMNKARRLRGEISIPGDKSISHRSVMFGSLAKGITEVDHFLTGADCLSTISCFRKMGIDITLDNEHVVINGKGLHGLTAPSQMLDCGNSGTTTRLISGILAGQPFSTTLTGDASIQKRPMGRIIKPLTMMGAGIRSMKDNGCAPLEITPSKLNAIHYESPVASAQVKSSIILAGLYADGITKVTEPTLSRNHTEIMLKSFGADITSDASTATATLVPGNELFGRKITVPGDISSAAYFLVAGLIVPGSEILIKNVGINETRDGILRALLAMGADITLLNEDRSGEPVADLLVRSSSLHGTIIEGDIIPTLIDEIPVLAIAAAFAEGETIIKDAAELKVKESDRIAVMTENLSALGCDITATDDGMIINGGRQLHGGSVKSYDDHRIAMSFAVAALSIDGDVDIEGADCVNISYPCFYSDLASISE